LVTTVTIDNKWTTIESSNNDILDIADEASRYVQHDWERARTGWLNRLQHEKRTSSREYQDALSWDGTRPIGIRRGNVHMIPTGCTTKFITACAFSGFTQMNIINRRTQHNTLKHVDWKLKPHKIPRPYQINAVDAFIDSSRRGIIKSPTGSGKSYMMAMLISQLKTTTLIKVPKIVLLKQLRKEILDSLHMDDNEIGTIGGGSYDPSTITITTTDSLSNIFDDKQRWNDLMTLHARFGWGLLIEDECHRAATDTSYKTTMGLDIYNKVGFSATPLNRSDNKDIMTIGAYGEILYEIDASVLVENKFLIRPKVTFIPLRPVPLPNRTPWNQVYNTAIVFNGERNEKIIEIARRLENEGRHTLIFVDRLDHGDQLHALTANTNNPIPFIHGEADDREEVIDFFKDGTYPTIIATTGIIGEGFDYPGLNAIIIGDGKKSFIKIMQQSGRGSRIFEDKTDLVIYDFGDRAQYITDHARQRISTWRQAKFDVDLSQTPYLM